MTTTTQTESDRRVPTNADLLAVLYETRSEMTILQSRVTAMEQRLALLDRETRSETRSLRETVENAMHRLDAHMLSEERERSALMMRLNTLLLAVLGAVGLAALDVFVNYLGK